MKPFRAIEKEELINGIKAWDLYDDQGCYYTASPVTIEEAIKISDFNLTLISTMGVYTKELATKDMVYYKVADDDDVCCFRKEDYTLASNNYFAADALMKEVIEGSFIWASSGCIEYLPELVSEMTDEDEDDTTLLNFFSDLTENITHKNVFIRANSIANLELGKSRIDNLISEGFSPIDYYVNDNGEIFSGIDSYHALLPLDGGEELNLTISEAIKFITTKIKP